MDKQIENYKKKVQNDFVIFKRTSDGVSVVEIEKVVTINADGDEEIQEKEFDHGLYSEASCYREADEKENRLPELEDQIKSAKQRLDDEKDLIKFLRKDLAPDLKEIEDAEDSETEDQEIKLINEIKDKTK